MKPLGAANLAEQSEQIDSCASIAASLLSSTVWRACQLCTIWPHQSTEIVCNEQSSTLQKKDSVGV